MIIAEELCKSFGTYQAVNKVSFSVAAGQVMVLLGPNGAGKTTTIRMLTSILRPSSGRASVAGYDVITRADEVRASVGVLTEQHGLYVRMRAYEYLEFYSQLFGIQPEIYRRRIPDLLEKFGLDEFKKMRLGEFSKGMRQKLALVRALLHDPPVLLLDEPTSALDPESARVVREAIVALRSTNRAIIICTHNLPEAEELADHIAIIRRGRIILQGSPMNLKRELLGPPEYIARLAAPVMNLPGQLPEGVLLVDHGDQWLRFRIDKPEENVPVLVKQMVAGFDLPLLSFQESARSLEQVYLQAIFQAAQEESYVG